MEDKEEKESYIHLNAELQRIARRDEKAFLSMQRNRGKQYNGKDRDLFKKLEYQGNISFKDGHNYGQKMIWI